MWWGEPDPPPRRPEFWPEWVPNACPGCNASWLLETVRGREHSNVRSTFQNCSCPGATGRPRGHVPVRCEATPGCRTVVWPPEHVPDWVEPAERARQL